MSNPAVDVIQLGVRLITEGMSQGVFNKDDLEAIRNVFQSGLEATKLCLARGPNKGDDDGPV